MRGWSDLPLHHKLTPGFDRSPSPVTPPHRSFVPRRHRVHCHPTGLVLHRPVGPSARLTLTSSSLSPRPWPTPRLDHSNEPTRSTRHRRA